MSSFRVLVRLGLMNVLINALRCLVSVEAFLPYLAALAAAYAPPAPPLGSPPPPAPPSPPSPWTPPNPPGPVFVREDYCRCGLPD